jgi:hypothetical protein
MVTAAKERMRKSRARRRLGLRPVQVLVSEKDIDFLLARHYELTRTDDQLYRSGGGSVPVSSQPKSWSDSHSSLVRNL